MTTKAKTIQDFDLSQILDVYINGFCESEGQGSGGWGTIIVQGQKEMELGGGAEDTKINRMKLTAIIEALKLIPPEVHLNVHVNTEYISDNIYTNIHDWKRNGWNMCKTSRFVGRIG